MIKCLIVVSLLIGAAAHAQAQAPVACLNARPSGAPGEFGWCCLPTRDIEEWVRASDGRVFTLLVSRPAHRPDWVCDVYPTARKPL